MKKKDNKRSILNRKGGSTATRKLINYKMRLKTLRKKFFNKFRKKTIKNEKEREMALALLNGKVVRMEKRVYHDNDLNI